MKAIVFSKYGSPEVLKLKEISTPLPGQNEIQVEVHASTVTAGDCEIRRMDFPWWIKIPLSLAMGVFRPYKRRRILGAESSGTVSAVGEKVSNFKPGDEIFSSNGLRFGGYAEYCCLKADHRNHLKPENWSFEEAATLIVGGVNGLHFTRLAEIKAHHTVMIYGATGSIGTYALQMAANTGATVHAVGSPGSEELLRSLGAQEFIDFTQEDFTERNQEYDVIIECVGKANFRGCIKRVKRNGKLLLANPKMNQMLRAGSIRRKHGIDVIFKFASETEEQMAELKRLAEACEIRSVIDRSFSLEDVKAAHEYVELGRKVGHVVVRVKNGKWEIGNGKS